MVERNRRQKDRQTTDGRQADGRQHIANVNVTFAKNRDAQKKRTSYKSVESVLKIYSNFQ